MISFGYLKCTIINFPKDSIIICDRGYVSYKLIADFNEKKQKFVIRCKDIDAKTSILRRFDLPDSEFDKTVSVTMTRSNVHYNSNRKKYALVNSSVDFPQIESWSAEDYELSYRVVRVKLDDENYETLITNLSEEEMPFDNMKELYHFRWKIMPNSALFSLCRLLRNADKVLVLSLFNDNFEKISALIL